MRVIIVGGGFGGVRAALALANKQGFDVKLISNLSYFEYPAALYRSATGRSPLEVAIPLNEFFDYAHNVEVIKDKIIDIQSHNKKVIGESESRYEYDRIIFALGNTTAYYNIKGLEEHAYGVKSIHEALRFKRHLHEQLLSTQSDVHYVVVGAGPTGVELSAELKSYLKKIRHKHAIKHTFTVELVEASPRPLSAMPEDFSNKITQQLKRLGVKTHYNVAVKSETADKLKLPNGSIQTHTVVWTAGITNNPFFSRYPDLFIAGKLGRIKVDQYFQASPGIYVIGDSADTKYAGLAQTALRDASLVAKNLVRQSKNKKLHPYNPKKPVYAIPVGNRWAAVLWGEVRIYGYLGWLLRRLADLRLYLTFLSPRKAMTTWRYGFEDQEACPVCKK